MSKKILIVDDQPGIRLLLNEIFKKEGYETYLAANGLEGMHYIDNIVMDCILVDMKIPGLSGIEIIEKIRGRNLNVPVIMMTAYMEKELMRRATQLDVEHYFTKPFNVIEVRDEVNKLLK